MTPGEIILASIAGLALFVACLARLDSKKSADAAQKSADAAQKSADANQRVTELMAQQLELATAEQNRTLQKDRSDSYPFFNWNGGSYSPAAGKCGWTFQNLGAIVTDVKIQTETKGISASINPRDTLLNNGAGQISFEFERKISQDLALPVIFSISCITKLGERWEKRYQMIGERAPQRIVEFKNTLPTARAAGFN